jgi:hypothetical protein
LGAGHGTAVSAAFLDINSHSIEQTGFGLVNALAESIHAREVFAISVKGALFTFHRDGIRVQLHIAILSSPAEAGSTAERVSSMSIELAVSLPVSWESFEIFLGSRGKLNGPSHVLPSATVLSVRPLVGLHLRSFTFRENIVDIHQPLGLDCEASAFNGHFPKIALLKLESIEHCFRDYHLASLADPADGSRLC